MPEWSQRTDQQGYYKENHPLCINQVSASLFHWCVDMHIPNNRVCFPHTTIDSKHDFTNSNERKHSYVWNLMHNSVQRIWKIDSFQNVWNMILMSCCSPSVTVNTHAKKMLWTFSFMTKATISAPKREWSSHFLVGIIWNYTHLNPLHLAL